MSKVHTFETSGDAYDCVQCDPEVKTGDILHIPSERVVGIAYTWPFSVTEEHGALHWIADNEDGAKIRKEFETQIEAAIELCKQHDCIPRSYYYNQQ